MKIYLYPTFFAILPSDIGGGPGKFARNDNPHEMDMSKYRRDFLEAREEAAKTMNLPTTDPVVRAQARLIVRHEHFEPDKRAWLTENSGAVDYEGEREFAIINGQATYLNNDGSPSKFTFSGFHERTLDDEREKVRASYSQDAHRADLLLQASLVNATDRVEVSKFAHDPRGIRDVYTFIYDPATNRGKIRVKNMAPDGKFLSPQQAQERMRSSFPDRQEIHVNENVFILTTDSSASSKILSSYNDYVEDKIDVSDKHAHTKGFFSETQVVATNAMVGVIDEVRVTGEAVAEYTSRQLNKRKEEDTPHADQESFSAFPPNRMVKELLTDPEKGMALTVLTGDELNINLEDKSEEEIIDIWRTKAQEVLEISPEQSEKLLEEVHETWTMMTDAKEVVSFVNDTGVGIAAAIYAIDMMTLENYATESQVEKIFEETEEVQAAAEMISFVADTELGIAAGLFALQELATQEVVEDVIVAEPIVLTEKEKKVVFSLFTSEEEIVKVPEIVDVIVLKEIIEFVQKIDVLTIEEQQKAIVVEKEKTEEKIVHLWEIITKPKSVATIHAPTEIVNLEPKEKEVEQFSFAFAVWAILKLINYRAALTSLVAKPSLVQWIQKEKPEGLVQKETGQWVLLAIIWYLAMIREQAVQSQQAPPKQKKKKRKEVVIYAYAS